MQTALLPLATTVCEIPQCVCVTCSGFSAPLSGHHSLCSWGSERRLGCAWTQRALPCSPFLPPFLPPPSLLFIYPSIHPSISGLEQPCPAPGGWEEPPHLAGIEIEHLDILFLSLFPGSPPGKSITQDPVCGRLTVSPHPETCQHPSRH